MEQRDKLWDPDTTVKLIKAIEQYRWLWDTQHADFRDILKKRRTFTGIGAEFGCNGSQVERKWKDLLNQYRHEKIHTNTMSAASSWFAFDHMRFVDARDSQNSLAVSTKASPNASFANASNSYLQAYKWHRRKYPTAMTTNDAGVVVERWHPHSSKVYTSPSTINKNRDEFEIFGEGVAAKLRKIQDPRIQVCVQRDIDNTLYDALMSSGVTKLPLNAAALNANNRKQKKSDYMLPVGRSSLSEQP